MGEIMDASRGLSLQDNRLPTEPRPLIPILPFHTSLRSTHTTHIHLYPPPAYMLWQLGDNGVKLQVVQQGGLWEDSYMSHQDTLSLCIVR